MRYTHLTQDERYQIHALQKAGHIQSQIASVLERSKSSICRELKRNCSQRGYRAAHAQQLSRLRIGDRNNAPRVSKETWAFADMKLALQWSPEQISGYLKANHMPSVSHESIYLSTHLQ